MGLRHRDNITVSVPVDSIDRTEDLNTYEHEGTEYAEIEVWNWLNITMSHQVRGENFRETFLEACSIQVGGSGLEPDYITRWAAHGIYDEYGIYLFGDHDEFDIEVVDIESPEVKEV